MLQSGWRAVGSHTTAVVVSLVLLISHLSITPQASNIQEEGCFEDVCIVFIVFLSIFYKQSVMKNFFSLNNKSPRNFFRDSSVLNVALKTFLLQLFPHSIHSAVGETTHTTKGCNLVIISSQRACRLPHVATHFTLCLVTVRKHYMSCWILLNVVSKYSRFSPYNCCCKFRTGNNKQIDLHLPSFWYSYYYYYGLLIRLFVFGFGKHFKRVFRNLSITETLFFYT